MARYKNGQVPRSRLKQYQQGNVTFWGTAYLIWQWVRMVAYVRKHYGITLYITTSATSVINGEGINMYRWLAAQQVMRNRYGSGAARVGTSSHGGTFEGRDAMAVDVANWAILDRYHGHGTFYRVARMFGFTPGLITRARGYARTEKWHLVMFNPYRAVPTVSGSQTDTADAEEEDEDMAKNVMHHTTDDKYKYRIGVTNPGSGFALVYVTSDPDINNELAKQYDTGSSVKVSRSLFDAIIRSTAAVAPQGELEVKVVEV